MNILHFELRAGINLLPRDTVARYLSISESTLQKYIREGKLKSKRIGKAVYIPQHSLAEFLNTCDDGHRYEICYDNIYQQPLDSFWDRGNLDLTAKERNERKEPKERKERNTKNSSSLDESLVSNTQEDHLNNIYTYTDSYKNIYTDTHINTDICDIYKYINKYDQGDLESHMTKDLHKESNTNKESLEIVRAHDTEEKPARNVAYDDFLSSVHEYAKGDTDAMIGIDPDEFLDDEPEPEPEPEPESGRTAVVPHSPGNECLFTKNDDSPPSERVLIDRPPMEKLKEAVRLNLTPFLKYYPELENFDALGFLVTFCNYYDEHGWTSNWRNKMLDWLTKDYNRKAFTLSDANPKPTPRNSTAEFWEKSEKGSMAYKDLCRKIDRGYDLVCVDQRVVYAVNSMGGYISFCTSSEPEDEHRKEFAKHYANCPDDYNEHVLEGNCNFADGKRHVRFLGDIKECIRIAAEHYGNMGVDPYCEDLQKPKVRETLSKPDNVMDDETRAKLTALRNSLAGGMRFGSRKYRNASGDSNKRME